MVTTSGAKINKKNSRSHLKGLSARKVTSLHILTEDAYMLRAIVPVTVAI